MDLVWDLSFRFLPRPLPLNVALVKRSLRAFGAPRTNTRHANEDQMRWLLREYPDVPEVQCGAIYHGFIDPTWNLSYRVCNAGLLGGHPYVIEYIRQTFGPWTFHKVIHAIMYGHTQIVEAAFSEGSVTCGGSDGYWFSHYAGSHGSPDCIRAVMNNLTFYRREHYLTNIIAYAIRSKRADCTEIVRWMIDEFGIFSREAPRWMAGGWNAAAADWISEADDDSHIDVRQVIFDAWPDCEERREAR